MTRTKRQRNYKNITESLNKVKRSLGDNKVSRIQLEVALSDAGIPRASCFIAELEKTMEVKMEQEGTSKYYTFRGVEPIYKGIVEACYKSIDERWKNYGTEKKEDKEERMEIVSHEEAIKNAVKLLKAEGYKILRSKIEWEEV